MQVIEIISLVGTVILFCGLIIAIIQLNLLGRQVQLMMEQMHDKFEWSCKQATFDYLSKYRSELRDTNLELQKRLDLLRQDGQMDPAAIVNSLRTDETRLQLFELVFYFEHLAVGIENEFFDETIAREFLSNVVTSTYNSIVPYIKIRRKETGSRIAGHFEALAKRWTKLGFK